MLYGHENGLTACWRGGKLSRGHGHGSQTNGRRGADQAVSLDSGDEEDSGGGSIRDVDVQLSSDLEEDDSSESFDRVLCQVDIKLPTAVTNIAVPQIPSNAFTQPSDSLPSLLTRKVVVLAAGADGSLRLLTFAQSPASTTLKVHETLIEKEDSHGKIPSAISISWTSHDETKDDEDGMEIDEVQAPKSRSRVSKTTSTNSSWDLLAAAARGDRLGSISLWRIPLVDASDTIAKATLFRTQSLPSPATTISFNTAPQPSRRHTQLLIVDSTNVARIYDPGNHHRSAVGRNSSIPPIYSGTWLACFYPPLQTNTTNPQRLCIHAAQWAFAGKAIFVLLEGGQWGLWDLEGIGPDATASAPGTTISGGGITQFALRGSLSALSASHSTSLKKGLATGDSNTTADTRKLAPMTPNTRRAKQEVLFAGNTGEQARPQGGISLQPSELSERAGVSALDESVLLWYGSTVYAIPSLRAYWERSRKKGAISTIEQQDVFDSTASGPGIMRLPSISTGGELITSVAQFTPSLHASSNTSTRLHHDVLVTAEHRIVVRCAINITPEPSSSTSDPVARRLLFREHDVNAETSLLDADLLSRRELDLGGIDRMLDGLGGGRRVGFLADR